ncbi:MAG: DedA family protein [Methylobacteriaceae bacterium]|nr:DedA family protein [Methylobacteriaceae bacterium]
MSHETIHQFIAAYGLIAVAGMICLESFGLPLPGEATLIASALYAGANGDSVVAIVAAAIVGAIVGDNIGYLVGRRVGYPLLLRHGAAIGVTPARLKLGRYVFARWGAMTVFLGRFVAALRILAAFLAGVNRLGWRVFLIANAGGAAVWASAIGFGANALGHAAGRLHGPLAWIGAAFATAAMIAAAVWLKRHEAALTAASERAFPDADR